MAAVGTTHISLPQLLGLVALVLAEPDHSHSPGANASQWEGASACLN